MRLQLSAFFFLFVLLLNSSAHAASFALSEADAARSVRQAASELRRIQDAYKQNPSEDLRNDALEIVEGVMRHTVEVRVRVAWLRGLRGTMSNAFLVSHRGGMGFLNLMLPVYMLSSVAENAPPAANGMLLTVGSVLNVVSGTAAWRKAALYEPKLSVSKRIFGIFRAALENEKIDLMAMGINLKDVAYDLKTVYEGKVAFLDWSFHRALSRKLCDSLLVGELAEPASAEHH